MRAYIYCRVAHDDSFSLEHQRFLLQLYAKRAGYTIIGASDECGNGLTLDRPALQKVTEAVVAGKVDVVLVQSLDRIGREWGMAKKAGRKILCKRFSTKSRMALESRVDSGLNPLITESHGGQSGMRAGTA